MMARNGLLKITELGTKMNERIKQLAEQVGFEFNLLGGTYTTGTLSDNLEKFAELIVQECIDYCGENLSKTVGGALKIHFGVDK